MTNHGDIGHVAYIRLGWQLLGHTSAEEPAVAVVCETLRSTSDQHHETITRAFVHLVQAGRSTLPSTHSFDEFCLMHPELLRTDALALYYSSETLLSAEARTGWVAPDLRALPPRAD
jgi:hypothetical protein